MPQSATVTRHRGAAYFKFEFLGLSSIIADGTKVTVHCYDTAETFQNLNEIFQFMCAVWNYIPRRSTDGVHWFIAGRPSCASGRAGGVFEESVWHRVVCWFVCLFAASFVRVFFILGRGRDRRRDSSSSRHALGVLSWNALVVQSFVALCCSCMCVFEAFSRI